VPAILGDQLWQGGTNYGAIDDPAGPPKIPQPAAAVVGPGGHFLGGPVVT